MGAWVAYTEKVRLVALRLAVDLVEVHCTLYSWICCLQIREAINALVVADKNHCIERIFKVLCHKFFLDIRTTFVDKVEGNFKRCAVVELILLLWAYEVFGRYH